MAVDCAAPLLSQIDHESVVGRREGDLVLVLEYVGGHVGDDDALGGEPVPMGVEVGETEVVGDVFVPVVGLGDEQIDIRGGIDQCVRPGGVAGRCGQPCLSPRQHHAQLHFGRSESRAGHM